MYEPEGRLPDVADVLVSTDWVAVHVTAQVLLLTVIVAHVGLVLKHTVVRRHRHLARML